ncbi:MAG: WD40 repeat domain-containing serine/threonine-protein kinase [Pirellulaceae bacterium]
MNEESIVSAALRIEGDDMRGKWIAEQCGDDLKLLRRVREQVEQRRTRDVEANDQDGEKRKSPTASVLDALSRTLGGVRPSIVLRDTHTLGDGTNEEELSGQFDVAADVSRTANGVQVGRYVWQDEIARGGMGAIIRGRDTDLGRDLAIKVLLERHKDDPECMRRFVEEAQIGGQLQHPGIVPIYELGRAEDNRPFFTMKLVKGRTLSQLLKDSASEDNEIGRLLAIFEQVCQTMAYAHSRGVVHRDLKPSNIMVGAFGEVQVMDWGLAKVLMVGDAATIDRTDGAATQVSVIRTVRNNNSDSTGGGSSETRMGRVMGTFAYMPPEQALGEVDRLDERVDVFALGAVLCEILTGQPPYVATDARDAREVHRMACAGRLEACFQRLENCAASSELVAIAKCCLSAEVRDRPRHAGKVAEEMATYNRRIQERLRTAEHERIESETRAAEAVRRRRLYTFISALIVVMGLVAVGAALMMAQLAHEKGELALAEQQKSDDLEALAKSEQVTRLANTSFMLMDERPVVSTLLAIEAVKQSQEYFGNVLPVAHEALLNSANNISGIPLVSGLAEIHNVYVTDRWLILQGTEVVRVWDISQVARTGLFPEPIEIGDKGAKITSCVVSRDGNRLVVVNPDLKVVDLAEGSGELTVIDWTSDSEITLAGMDASGRWLVTSTKGGSLDLRDLNSPPTSEVRVLGRSLGKAARMHVAANGHRVVSEHVNKDDERIAYVWNLQDRESTGPELSTEGMWIFRARLSDDSRWLTIEGGGIRVWDLEQNENRYQFPLPEDLGASWPRIANGWMIVVGANSTKVYGVKMEDIAQQRFTVEWNVHHEGVSPIETSRDGKWIITGGRDGEAMIWDMDAIGPNYQPIALGSHDLDISVAVSADGRRFATVGTDGTVRLWNNPVGPIANSSLAMHGYDESFPAFAVSQNGRWICVSGRDGSAKLWSVDDGYGLPTVRILKGHTAQIYKITISSDNRWLVTASLDEMVRIWDLTKEKPEESPIVFNPGQGRLFYAAVDVTHGRLITVGFDSRDELVKAWSFPDLHAKPPTVMLKKAEDEGSNRRVCRVALSNDDGWLAVGMWSRNTWVWDLNRPDQMMARRQIVGEATVQFGMTLDSHSKRLVTGGMGSPNVTMVKLDHEVRNAKTISIRPPGNDDTWLGLLSPNEEWLFLSRSRTLAELRNVRTGNAVPRLIQGHRGAQVGAMSPDSRWLVMGTRRDGVLCDLTAEHPELATMHLRTHRGGVWECAFTNDSRWLITDSNDGTVRRWPMDMNWLVDYAQRMACRELTQEERKYYKVDFKLNSDAD